MFPLFIDFEFPKEVGELNKANGYNSPRKDIFKARTYKKFYGTKSVEELTKWQEILDRLILKK